MPKKLTEQEVRDNISKIDNGEYELIGHYINSKTPIKIKHKCGRIMEIQYGKFTGKRAQRCRCLFEHHNKMSLDEFKKRLFEKHGNNYEIVNENEYVDYNTPIYFIHKPCGNKYKRKPDNVIRCNTCVECSYTQKLRASNNTTKTLSQIKNEIDKITEGSCKLAYDINYINNKQELPILHKECGKISMISFNDISVKNTRCRYCSGSKGELIIQDYLDTNNIKYEREKIFDNLIDEKHLRFDFYIENYNHNLLIEFDGIQHFEPTFGKDDVEKQNRFELTQKHDNMKNEYSRIHDINLLRIRYDEIDKINKILDDYFYKVQRLSKPLIRE